MSLLTNTKDNNRGIAKASRPCTNQNSIHPPQLNGNVLSKRREFVVCGPSTTVESLFSTFGGGPSITFKKYDSTKCRLANSFLQPNKIFSSVTRRSYSCTSYGKSYLACH